MSRRSQYALEPEDKLSADEVAQNITRRAARVAGQVEVTRGVFQLTDTEIQASHNAANALTMVLESQAKCHALVSTETWLALYDLWTIQTPQIAVDRAFEFLIIKKTTSPWLRAVSESQCEAARMWLEINNLEIQSVEISWPQAIGQMR